MLKTVKKITDQVVIWQSSSHLFEDEQRLNTISQWWNALDGQSVMWEVWFYPFSCTEPITAQPMMIEKPRSLGSTLQWQKSNSPECLSITAQKLSLDYALEKLDITPYHREFDVSPGQVYRVKMLR